MHAVDRPCRARGILRPRIDREGAMSGLPSVVDTVVIGAGHAGLIASWHLRRLGREHVVLDRRATLGGAGRTAGTRSSSSRRTS